MGFSILIPACNEEQSLRYIAQTVYDSFLWKTSKKRELIICANGCNDNTEAVAQDICNEHENTSVIVSREKSKNKAWMSLVKESSINSNILIFMDADIRVPSKTFELLYQELLHNQSIEIAGASPFPASDGRSLFQKLCISHLNDQKVRDKWTFTSCLRGHCYAIRRSTAIKVEMPDDPRIADDYYLDLLFINKVKLLPDAKCYFKAATFTDRILQRARHRVSDYLIAQRFPDLLKKDNRIPKKKSSSSFLFEQSLKGKITVLYCYPVEIASIFLSKWWLATGADPWPTVHSTKLERM